MGVCSRCHEKYITVIAERDMARTEVAKLRAELDSAQYPRAYPSGDERVTKHPPPLPSRLYKEKRDLALAEQKSGEQILRVVESVEHFKMLEKRFGPKISHK